MVRVRPELPEDFASIDEINRLALDGEEEAKLIKAIRDYFIPELSLVAVEYNHIVGHILSAPY